MSRFTEEQFYQVILNIKEAEEYGDNIGLPIGILEYMYDDDSGYIDEYFSNKKSSIEAKDLWNKLQGQITRNNLTE